MQNLLQLTFLFFYFYNPVIYNNGENDLNFDFSNKR